MHGNIQCTQVSTHKYLYPSVIVYHLKELLMHRDRAECVYDEVETTIKFD